jgi:hypothetical protein
MLAPRGALLASQIVAHKHARVRQRARGEPKLCVVQNGVGHDDSRLRLSYFF